MKKKIISALLLAIPILTILIFYLCRKADYEIKYQVKGLNVTEKRYDDLNMYYFQANYNESDYEIAVTSDFINDHLIDDILIASDNDITCLYFKSEKVTTYPVCKSDNVLTSYNLLKTEITDYFGLKKANKINKKYKNIKINSMYNDKVFIWNHFGYSVITKDKNYEINLFNNETYSDIYSFQVSNYILVPDYDQKYEFDKFYIIDMKSGEVNTIKLETNISFNYYFLGEYDNEGYIFDKKNEKEYAINPKKEKIEVVSDANYGKVFLSKWEEVSLIKLKNTEYSFDVTNIFNYFIENNKLYCKYYKGKSRTLVSRSADKIVFYNNEKVYYTYDDKLYVTSPFIKETLLLEYDEITFNKGLSIYMY